MVNLKTSKMKKNYAQTADKALAQVIQKALISNFNQNILLSY